MSAASTSSADPWDAPVPAPVAQRRAAPALPVRDDWDADEAEDEEQDDPQTVWENANKQAPMPELVISGSSSSTSSLPPPPAAFQPGIRILKRPTASAPSIHAAAAAEPKTFAERTADYEAARRRIFEASQSNASKESAAGTGEGVVRIVREPRGPAAAPGGEKEARVPPGTGPSRGFGGRRNPGPEEREGCGKSAARGGAA